MGTALGGSWFGWCALRCRGEGRGGAGQTYPRASLQHPESTSRNYGYQRPPWRELLFSFSAFAEQVPPTHFLVLKTKCLSFSPSFESDLEGSVSLGLIGGRSGGVCAGGRLCRLGAPPVVTGSSVTSEKGRVGGDVGILERRPS